MRFLVTTFEGGGHVPPAIMLAARLRALGHEVLFVSDSANAGEAQAASLRFASWVTAPNRQRAGTIDDPLQDWRSRWPPAVVRSICDSVITGPALRYARDTAAFMDVFRPDVVVSSELLFGVMAAAESKRVPLALLSANVWCFPTRSDVPPFGPGFAPATGRFSQGRERGARDWIARLYDAGLEELNLARRALDLPPLEHTLQQLDASALILLATSAAFDYSSAPPPRPFLYVGPLLERAFGEGTAPALHDAPRKPRILISFSTTFQNQTAQVARCIHAMAKLPVEAIVTLGPALHAGDLPAAPNVSILVGASHDRILESSAALICHGGHGTLLRALLHGVPVICVPSMRDQPENAARLAWHGAGLRLARAAGERAIRSATLSLLEDSRYRLNAVRLGERIRAETDDGSRAAAALCELAWRDRSTLGSTASG